MEDIVLFDSREKKPIIDRLIKASHKKHIDLMTTISWDIGVDKKAYPKNEKHMWLFGTEYFDCLTDAQKVEMAWLEVARDASFFIHFEQIIPNIFSFYINKNKHEIDESIYDYMLLFAREELTHIMMFHKYLEKGELPWYRLPPEYSSLAKLLPQLNPAVGILYTLLIEWTSENAVVASVEGFAGDKLTKNIWMTHHREEARHIQFGKIIGEEFFARASEDLKKQARSLLRSLVKQMHYVYNFNPDIQEYLSFKLPFDVKNESVIHEIRSSDHNKKLNSERFASIINWCERLDIL